MNHPLTVKSSYASLLDKTFETYRKNICHYIVLSIAMNLVFFLISGLLIWGCFSLILPNLQSISNNSIVSGIYSVFVLASVVGLAYVVFKVFFFTTNYIVTKLTLIDEFPSFQSIFRTTFKAVKFSFSTTVAKGFIYLPLLALFVFLFYKIVGLSPLMSVVMSGKFSGNIIGMFIILGIGFVVFLFLNILFSFASTVALEKKYHFFKALLYSCVLILEDNRFRRVFLVKLFWNVIVLSFIAVLYGIVGIVFKPLPLFKQNALLMYLYPFYKILIVYFFTIVFQPLQSIFNQIICLALSTQVEQRTSKYFRAGIGSRSFSFLADLYIVVGILVFVINISFSLFSRQNGSAFSLENMNIFVQVAFVMLFLSILTTYHVLCEMLWKGQTLGKRILNLRVVTLDNKMVGVMQSLIRNLCKFSLDFFGIGLILAFFRKDKCRIGDLLAETKVIAKR